MGQGFRRESDFRWDEFAGMPVADKIRKCHEMATEAEDLSARADHNTREVYIALARQWSTLANEIQNSEHVLA